MSPINPANSRVASPISDATLKQAAAIIKCLGHPLRLRLLEALESGEKTVSELRDHAGASQAAVSQQLGVLRGNHVVDNRREGAFVYYRIIEPKVAHILHCVRTCDVEK